MKFKILPLVFIFILLLTSCSKSSPHTQNTTGEDDGIVYPETDISGMTVTYILTPDGAVPISVCEGGYSLLTSENYYYNLQNTVDMNADMPNKSYTAFTDSGINCGSVSFDDITAGKVEGESFHTLVTSGNWKLCPNIRKTSYDGNADSSYCDFIYQSFPDNFASAADIKVTDIWEYDADDDGNAEAVVLSKTDDYTVLAMLSQTIGNKILASTFVKGSDFTAAPFFADLDGNGAYSLITAWGDTLKTVSVYKENTLDEEYRVYLPI